MKELLCDVVIAFSITFFGHAPWWAGVIIFLVLRDMSWSHEAASLVGSAFGPDAAPTMVFADAEPPHDADAVTPESVIRISGLDRERIADEVQRELLKRQRRSGPRTRGDAA